VIEFFINDSEVKDSFTSWDFSLTCMIVFNDVFLPFSGQDKALTRNIFGTQFVKPAFC
jgi:hypothetical protein